MPLYDTVCDSGHATEQMLALKDRDKPEPCSECGKPTKRVLLRAPRIDWGRMAIKGVSPEFGDRFDRIHKQQREKEERSLEVHGDYGPRPGAD